MRFTAIFFVVTCILAVACGQGWFDRARNSARNTYNRVKNFGVGAYRGTKDMHRAYSDMREANWKHSDKYFHARGNQDAARHGSGGKFAAKAISNVRELTDRIRGGTAAQSAADQAANRFGRNGGDLNRHRPRGLPERY